MVGVVHLGGVDRRYAGRLLEADRPLWTTSCPLVENPEINGNSVAQVGVPLHRVVVPALAARTDLVCHVVVTGFNGVGVHPEGQLLIPVVRLVAQVSPTRHLHAPATRGAWYQDAVEGPDSPAAGSYRAPGPDRAWAQRGSHLPPVSAELKRVPV